MVLSFPQSYERALLPNDDFIYRLLGWSGAELPPNITNRGIFFNVTPLKDEQKCFACGKLNPYGLHLEFTRIDRNTLQTTFTPLDHHQGWAEYLHGGIISTILDEVMVRLAYELGLRVMTAEINVRYKQAIKIGTPLVAESKLIEQNKRLIRVEAELISPDRTIQYATATAKLIPLHSIE